MRKIKDIISKPSEALQAMVDGLLEQDARPDFIVDMGTFGRADKVVCFGCAATCALQKITNVQFLPEQDISVPSFRAPLVKIDLQDLWNFEMALNRARQGMLGSLFGYFFKGPQFIPEQDNYRFNLQNCNWREELPKVRAYIEVLRSRGL